MPAAVYGLYKDMPVQPVDPPPLAGSEPGLSSLRSALPSRLPRQQMAAFSYQHRLLFAPALDPSHVLTPPFELPLPQFHQHHQAGLASWLPCQHPSTAAGPAAAAPESSSSFSGGSRTVPSGDHRVASSSCSSAQMTEVASEMPNRMEKKRDERQRRRAGTAQPNDAKEPRSRKQKKCRIPATEPPAAEKKRKTSVREVPPAGYIHVRARRGQATDSHSLAERARREKIGERMKMLQGLVPGCDKVVGKALVLDEIINYVQSLQHQVEFLSMKLAAANPVFHDSCFDLEFMDGYGEEKLERSSPSLLSAQQAAAGRIQATAFTETAINCPVQDTSIPFLLHGQGPNAFPQGSGNSFMMQMGENRQTFFQ